MRRIATLFVEAARSVLLLARSTREAYDGATRFARMRVWILAILAADVCLVALLAARIGSTPLDLEVWYEPGFPSNLLIVRNQEKAALSPVTLVLDGRYELRLERLEPGVRGFEVSREFRDAQQRVPADDYRPATVEVRAAGAEMALPIQRRSGP